MALIRRQRLLPRERNTRSARIFVIATEGAQTEKKYFEYFNELASRQPFEALPVSITVLPPLENRSSPKAVLEQVKDFVGKHSLDPRDPVWLVLDVDRWPPHILAKVVAASGRRGFQVAISNPCFEVWLCFHIAECEDEAIAEAAQDRGPGHAPKANLVRLLRRALGSHKEGNPDMTFFEPAQPQAIFRAHTADTHSEKTHPVPPSPATRVYRLVQEIRSGLILD